MSDYRAIAGVALTLRNLLRDRMELRNGLDRERLQISIGTPTTSAGNADGGPVAEDERINIFPYHIQENITLKNHDLPNAASKMAYGAPPLSLDLNVMLTAYGSELDAGETFINETRAELLLGSAMRVLHDYPIITPQILTVNMSYGQPILHESLHSAYESVKLTLIPITLEDITKVWTALTIPYRLSVAYAISVIQIESQAARRYPRLVGAPPIGGPGVVAVPLDQPGIDAVYVRRAGDPPTAERPYPYARVGDTLILVGRNFGRAIKIDMNGLLIPVKPLSATRIEVEIPDTTIAGETILPESRLQPGPQSVEVLSAIEGLDNFRMRSNRVLYMLVPLVTSTSSGPGGEEPQSEIIIHGRRLYLADSNMQTLIGNALFDGRAYVNPNPTQITVTLPDMLPHRSAACFVGQSITDLDNLDPTPELRVRIEGDGYHRLAFTYSPDTLEAVANELEKTLRGAPTENIAFKGARVSLLGNRLVIVPGGLSDTVDIRRAGGNAATVLGLLNETNRFGYLSGTITPFPTLSSTAPAVKLHLDGHTFDAVMNGVPHTIDEAAQLLQEAIQNGPTEAFSNTKVITVGQQLLILTGDNKPIIFASSAHDGTTIGKLHLRREYALRVRVNGAESQGNVTSVELPL